VPPDTPKHDQFPELRDDPNKYPEYPPEYQEYQDLKTKITEDLKEVDTVLKQPELMCITDDVSLSVDLQQELKKGSEEILKDIKHLKGPDKSLNSTLSLFSGFAKSVIGFLGSKIGFVGGGVVTIHKNIKKMRNRIQKNKLTMRYKTQRKMGRVNKSHKSRKSHKSHKSHKSRKSHKSHKSYKR
jgi:hypothetical protein